MDRNPKLIKYLTKKCSSFFYALDSQITRNLYASSIETRPAKQNGLWCCALLPVVLIFYNILYKVSPIYSLVAYTSFGLFFYCLLFIVFMSVSCSVLKESIYGGCIASSLVSALLLYVFLKKDLTFSLLCSVPTVFIFSMLLRMSLMRFPKTFTIGEAMIVVQSIVLYGLMTAATVVWDVGNTDEDVQFIHSIVKTVLSTVGLIVTALCVMTDRQRTLENLGYVIAGAVIFALLMLHTVLGVDCLLRIIYYVFFHKNRVTLVAFWLFLVIIAVFVLSMRTKLAVKASTVTRKSFHLLASLVFLTGIVFDQHLMLFAAGIGLGLVVLVEALRKSGIEPISSVLQSAFLVYCDDKDCGSFAMTPIYLYCGLACPLLLVPHAEPLELLSGVLAIGVGDTAASWFGSKYGFNKWADAKVPTNLWKELHLTFFRNYLQYTRFNYLEARSTEDLYIDDDLSTHMNENFGGKVKLIPLHGSLHEILCEKEDDCCLIKVKQENGCDTIYFRCDNSDTESRDAIDGCSLDSDTVVFKRSISLIEERIQRVVPKDKRANPIVTRKVKDVKIRPKSEIFAPIKRETRFLSNSSPSLAMNDEVEVNIENVMSYQDSSSDECINTKVQDDDFELLEKKIEEDLASNMTSGCGCLEKISEENLSVLNEESNEKE